MSATYQSGCWKHRLILRAYPIILLKKMSQWFLGKKK